METISSGDLLTPAKVDPGVPAGVNGPAVTSGTDTRASSSYANMAGTGSVTSVSWTKRTASSRVRIWMSASLYTSNAATGGLVGVQINGVDYDVVRIYPSLATSRQFGSGWVAPISGIPAGTYTVQARWRCIGGTHTITRDVNDWLSMMVEEVAAP